METTEHFARVSMITEILGKQVLLSGGDLEKLVAARARYVAGAHHSAPTAAEDLEVSSSGSTERVTLTRRELDALIDEAVRRDRTLR
jgi:hypothetical protein